MELRESALHDDDDGTSNEMSRRVLHKMQMSYDRDVLIAQAFVRSRVSSSSQENRDILEIELCMSVRDTVLRHRVNSMWISQIIAWTDYTTAFLKCETGREAALQAADVVAPDEFSFGNTIVKLSLDFENAAIRYVPSESDMQAYLGVIGARLTSNIVSYGLVSGFKVHFDDIELFVCPNSNENDLKIGDDVAVGSSTLLRESLFRAGFASVASLRENVLFLRFFSDDSMKLSKTCIDFEGGTLTCDMCTDSFVILRDCVSVYFSSGKDDEKSVDDDVDKEEEEKNVELDIFETIDFDAFRCSEDEDDKDSVEALLVEEYCCATRPPDVRVQDDGDWTLFDLVDDDLEEPISLSRRVSLQSAKDDRVSMKEMEDELRCDHSDSSEEEDDDEMKEDNSSSVMIETGEGETLELRLDSSFQLRDELAKIIMRKDEEESTKNETKETTSTQWFDGPENVCIRPQHIERPSSTFDPQDMFSKRVSDAPIQLTSRRVRVVVKIHSEKDWNTIATTKSTVASSKGDSSSDSEKNTTKTFNLNDALRESYYRVENTKRNVEMKRQRRRKDDFLELILEDLQCRTDIRTQENEQSTFRLAIKNVFVYDHFASSLVRTALSYWSDEQTHPRETNANMVRIYVRNVSSEYQIRVSVLPVRVNIDQDAVLCVTRFLKHVNLVGGEKNSSNEEEEDSMFIRSININAIKIKLDYVPRRFPNMSQIREMQVLEILSVIPLEKLELVLCETRLDSISGLERLFSEIGSNWGNDVMRKQLHRCLAGVQA